MFILRDGNRLTTNMLAWGGGRDLSIRTFNLAGFVYRVD